MASDRDAVTRRMRPGAWDPSGFLGVDEVLADRIAADVETCTRLGTTPEALGALLLDLLADTQPQVVGRTVTVHHADGTVTCPWALEEDEVCLRGPGGAPSADSFTITVGDCSLEGFTLSAHLIAIHRFFGGLESRFRIDPVRALAVLDPE
jgi:hypothetical protein